MFPNRSAPDAVDHSFHREPFRKVLATCADPAGSGYRPLPWRGRQRCTKPTGRCARPILLFKYGGRRTLARHLGRLMVEGAGRLVGPLQFDLLVPVPLHPKRERVRGFNQAALLAKEVGTGWGLRVGHRLLHRVRATEAQSGGRREREDNVKGAFVVARPDRVKDMRLLLIDDVFTTGATAGECAKTLLTAGAAEVGVYTLARVE